jgi:hypothetical protein
MDSIADTPHAPPPGSVMVGNESVTVDNESGTVDNESVMEGDEWFADGNATARGTTTTDTTDIRPLISSVKAYAIVKDFVTLKSFDVVSSGQYRKFVLRKKDLCEQWAMAMHDNYHTMILEVRQLAKYSVLAKSKGYTDVAVVCAKLLNCIECPHLTTSGWNTCTITKVQCMGGIRVNTSADVTPVMVHPRFLRFCLSYWYTARFEHVLRRVVRGKYSKIYCDDFTLSEVSNMILKDEEITVLVVNNFIHALTHVHKTMHQLLKIPARGSETLSNFAI